MLAQDNILCIRMISVCENKPLAVQNLQDFPVLSDIKFALYSSSLAMNVTSTSSGGHIHRVVVRSQKRLRVGLYLCIGLT
jgi:hypothetical protein